MALSNWIISVGDNGQELLQHGTPAFPIACYHDNLAIMDVPWHWHAELEAALVTEGCSIVAVENQKYMLRAGDAFFVNAHVLHSCRNLDSSGCRYHSMSFHPRLVGGSPDSVFFSEYLQPLMNNQALPFLHFTPDIPWHAEAIACIEEAWQACVQEPRGFEFAVRSALSRLVLLLTAHAPVQPKRNSDRAARSAQRIKTMLRYIQENYADDISIHSIAESAAISESECLRCFRGTIGTTPIQYLRHYRLQQAACLLRSTDMGIAEIAAHCGFQDASYFTRSFREMRGMTPGEYRRRP